MSVWNRLWIRCAAALLVVVFGVAALIGYLDYYVIARVPAPPNFPHPRDRAEAQHQDLQYLMASMHSLDRSFSPDAWEKFDRQVGDLEERAGRLSDAQFELGMARAVAFANNAHTNVDGVAKGVTLNSIPIRLDWFREGLFVVAAAPSQSDLVGGKLVAEGGRSPNEIVEALHPYVGGNAPHLRNAAPYFMESPAALNAIGLIQSAESVTLTIKFADGHVAQRTISAEPVPANGPEQSKHWLEQFREHHDAIRDLSPAEAPEDKRVWVRVLGRVHQVSLTLNDPYNFYWHTYLAKGHVLFIQLNACISGPGRPPLNNYLAQVLQEAKLKKPRYAIVDLRFNTGGNYTQTAEFTRALPKVIPSDGKIFILTSNNTFSAAIVTTARLKYFAHGRALIVGEPVGDNLQFWAEGQVRLVLPNSGLKIHYATGYHDWIHGGCSLWELLICNPQNYIWGVSVDSLAPDIYVPWSFTDYAEGRDTAMERIFPLIL